MSQDFPVKRSYTRYSIRQAPFMNPGKRGDLRPKNSPNKKAEQPKVKRAAANPSHGRWMWLLALGLLLATLAAYYPAWHGGMIWDDDAHVTRPELRSWHGLYRIWFDVGATLQYYPLLHTAFWIEHKLWGDSTLGYHLLNILLHAAAALMVAVILRRLSVPGAYLAAAIFALHPVHVESVAWITEQKNTLSAVFYLGAAMLLSALRPDAKDGVSTGRVGLCYAGAVEQDGDRHAARGAAGDFLVAAGAAVVEERRAAAGAVLCAGGRRRNDHGLVGTENQQVRRAGVPVHVRGAVADCRPGGLVSPVEAVLADKTGLYLPALAD